MITLLISLLRLVYLAMVSPLGGILGFLNLIWFWICLCKGFSDGASVTGLNPTEMAVIFRNLMLRLGYNKFLIQGGDWGSLIGASLATIFPENVIGYHSNMCGTMSPASTLKAMIAKMYPSAFFPEEHADFFYPMGEKFSYLIEESGYFHIQATKPDTIGMHQLNQLQFSNCFQLLWSWDFISFY